MEHGDTIKINLDTDQFDIENRKSDKYEISSDDQLIIIKVIDKLSIRDLSIDIKGSYIGGIEGNYKTKINIVTDGWTSYVSKDNNKILEIKLSEFKDSIERVTSVSSDRKEGLKMSISKSAVQLSVNNPNSGEGFENINAKFNSNELNISFNSKYLTDIASQIENEFIVINLKDANSPVLINDFSDKNSFYVVMPMKI